MRRQKPKWDNKKWKPEWREMQKRRRGQSAWNSIWRSVTTAYIGNDWVQELVSPFTSAVSSQEQIELTKLLNFGDNTSAAIPSSATSPMPSGGTPSRSTPTGGAPSGGVPSGGTPSGGK